MGSSCFVKRRESFLTLVRLLIKPSRCALTWKLVGTPYNRSYFQLRVSVLPIDETEFGLLLTPTSTERCEHPDDMRARAEKNGYKNGTKYNSLTSQIVFGMLPTPIAWDGEGGGGRKIENGKATTGQGYSARLKDLAQAQMLPTPNAFDWNTARSPEALASAKEKYGSTLQDTLRQRAGQGSQLSPLFVEEMMGFPRNWTASPFQSGEENP